MAVICGAALLTGLWWAGRKSRQLLGGIELQRLRRTAETIHRDQAQPYD